MQSIRLRNVLAITPLALALAGCTSGGLLFERAGWSTPHEPGTVPGASAAPLGSPEVPAGDPTGMSGVPADDTPLLGWDGGVVDGAPPGVREGDPGQGGIQPSTTGRMHIIELYQQVLDERDSLRREVGALTAALERSQATVAEIAEQQHGLEIRVNELETRNEAMLNENRDLAARLATAQIRRLEAEKLLLEARIDELRALESSAPRSVMPVEAPVRGGGQ